MIFLYTVLVLIVLALLAALGLYFAAFARTKENDFTKMTFKETSPYYIYGEELAAGVKYIRSLECEEVHIESFDGLKLRGRYYPVESPRGMALLFHGWRSLATNDFSCSVELLRSRGLDVLLVDERAHGQSEGRTITFGVKESRDCAAWAAWAAERFPGRKLILEGISMGAATVLMATALPLPETVCAVIADCGYTSPRDILEDVAAKKGLPAWLCYPLIRLGARLYGGFDPSERGAEEAMRVCRIPCLFIHGEGDGFVPCEMSRRNYAACAAEWKKLVIVPCDYHGFAYVEGGDAVRAGVDELFSAVL